MTTNPFFGFFIISFFLKSGLQKILSFNLNGVATGLIVTWNTEKVAGITSTNSVVWCISLYPGTTRGTIYRRGLKSKFFHFAELAWIFIFGRHHQLILFSFSLALSKGKTCKGFLLKTHIMVTVQVSSWQLYNRSTSTKIDTPSIPKYKAPFNFAGQ